MIGVAISTHRRPEVLARASAGWAAHLGGVAVLVVIHDEAGAGVAQAKNRSIAALMDAGCTELFLVDDDVWPICDGWWQPYVTHSEPHLMHCWGRSRFVSDDGQTTTWSWPRGVALYFERRVIEKVGGMRIEFRDAGEHAELSMRVHSAGLTKAPFQDASAARTGVWYCEDYTRRIPSSLPAARYGPEETRRRKALQDRFRGSTDYVEYRNTILHPVY